MAYDTTLPTVAQRYDTGWFPSMRANVVAIAMMLEPTDAGAVANPVAGLRRFNKATGLQERYDGTAWAVETVNISGNAATATKLATGRTLSLTGDVTWTSPAFDGSGNVTATATLANSGVTSGTYRSVTVDAKGRVTAGTNPTTLAGYAISDAYTKTQVDSALAEKAAAATTLAGYGITDGVTASALSTTLAGYALLSGAPTFSGLVKARGGGLGLGQISVTTTTGTPSGMSAGDLVLVY